MALAPVRDMALLDPFNPRSVAFQVNRIDEGLGTLPVLRRDGMLEEPRRLTASASGADYRMRQIAHRCADFNIRAKGTRLGKCDRRPLFLARSRRRPGGASYGTRVIYSITRLTRYTYGAVVELTTGVLRLAPGSGDGQEVQRFNIATDPVSQRLTERLDPFGNRAFNLRIEKPHRQLSIVASSRVQSRSSADAHRKPKLGECRRGGNRNQVA